MTFLFTNDAIDQFGKNYRLKAKPEHGVSSQGGCMKAVYIGLGTLFGEKYGFRGQFHRAFFKEARRKEIKKGVPEGRFNTIDRLFRALENELIVFSEQSYKPNNGEWLKSDGSTVASFEADLAHRVSSLPNGSHFFGVALSHAIHSLILRLHKTEEEVRVYWMDQFAKGYDDFREGSFVGIPDVTGRLDDEVLAFAKHPTSVWEFDPHQARDAVIRLDVDDDGIDDFIVRAATEVIRQ